MNNTIIFSKEVKVYTSASKSLTPRLYIIVNELNISSHFPAADLKVRVECGVGELRDLGRNTSSDELKGDIALRAIVRDVGDSEKVNEGASGTFGLGEGKPGEGLVGAPENGVVGELLENAVVVLVADQRGARAGELEYDALYEPVGIDVLAV